MMMGKHTRDIADQSSFKVQQARKGKLYFISDLSCASKHLSLRHREVKIEHNGLGLQQTEHIL
jgi:hypothetical protein